MRYPTNTMRQIGWYRKQTGKGKTRYTYDKEGKMVKVSCANGTGEEIPYDGAGQLTGAGADPLSDNGRDL